MKIDFKDLANSGKSDTREKAQVWINVGYLSDMVDEETGERRFVALPLGIPLDTQEDLATTSRNEDYAAFNAARNHLLAQVREVASTLKPGQSKILSAEGNGLVVQIRRVNEEKAGVVAGDSNPYAKKLAFG